MISARRILLASRPTGQPGQDNFRIEDFELPEANEGEVTVRSLYLSLDPYMRGRMSDAKSYAAPVPIGGVMEGEAISEVVKSRHNGFSPGDLVRGRTGWSSHAVIKGDELRVVETHGAPITTSLGSLGMPGFTAWAGLKFIGQPKAGETVAVAAASGPVGSMGATRQARRSPRGRHRWRTRQMRVREERTRFRRRCRSPIGALLV